MKTIKLIQSSVNKSDGNTTDKLPGLGIRIGEIAEAIAKVEKEVPVYKVREILDEKALSGIVVVENEVPLGLIMKNKLYYHLASKYKTWLEGSLKSLTDAAK